MKARTLEEIIGMIAGVEKFAWLPVSNSRVPENPLWLEKYMAYYHGHRDQHGVWTLDYDEQRSNVPMHLKHDINVMVKIELLPRYVWRAVLKTPNRLTPEVVEAVLQDVPLSLQPLLWLKRRWGRTGVVDVEADFEVNTISIGLPYASTVLYDGQHKLADHINEKMKAIGWPMESIEYHLEDGTHGTV